MSNRTVIIAGLLLILSGVVAGLAAGWVLFEGDWTLPKLSDLGWALVAAALAAVALAVLYLTAPRRFGEAVTWLLVAYLVCGALILGWLLISLWAPAQAAAVDDGAGAVRVHLFGTSENVQLEPTTIRLLLILTAGALGGVVNALWVLVARTGNASFRERWAWWYVGGPIFGSAAALGLSLAFGSSLVEFGGQADSDASDVGLLTFVAFVAGLFAKAVFERLSRLIPEPVRRTGPRITSTSPTVIASNATNNETVVIEGTGFTAATAVYYEGTRLSTTKDGNKLTVTLDPTVVGTRPIALEVVTEARQADAVVIPRS